MATETNIDVSWGILTNWVRNNTERPNEKETEVFSAAPQKTGQDTTNTEKITEQQEAVQNEVKTTQQAMQEENPEKEMVEITYFDNENPFSEKTMDLMYKEKTGNKLTDSAQEFLGTVEVKKNEYKDLTDKQKEASQADVTNNNLNHKWCAHTVSSICEEAGIDIDGHKQMVDEFVTWGNGKKIYNKIENAPKMAKENYGTQEEQERMKAIDENLKNVHSGDLMIQKSSYAVSTPDGIVEDTASHIGIFEKYDEEKGGWYVIEGNANNFETTEKFDRIVVENKEDGECGDQKEGEFKEANNRDGIIRKFYTTEEFLRQGYSGYIDMQDLIADASN